MLNKIPINNNIQYKIIVSIIRTINHCLSYFLMLIAMTYNSWLFLSIIVGFGIGDFIFFTDCQINNNDCCK